MKARIVNADVIKEDKGFSATAIIDDYFVASAGDTQDGLKSSFLEALDLALEEEGITYTSDDLRFEYDLESFFHFYRVINVKALSERIGMNQSLLAQYIKGIKNLQKPRQEEYWMVCTRSVVS